MNPFVKSMFRQSLVNLPAIVTYLAIASVVFAMLGQPLFAPLSLTIALAFAGLYAVTLMTWTISPWHDAWCEWVDGFVEEVDQKL